MKKISWNQLNDLWRNLRLTITAILFPALGLIFMAYYVCRPFREFVDRKLEKIFSKNDTTKQSFWKNHKD